MKDASPTTIYLKDYAPFPFRVKNVHLTFQLDPLKTRVISLVEFEPIAGASQHALFLHGEDLRLIWAKIDGAAVTKIKYFIKFKFVLNPAIALDL